MELNDIVMKLIGPVEPTGDCHEDARRKQNLEALISLTDGLLTAIYRIAYQNMASEGRSRREAGKLCNDFLAKVGIAD